MFSLLFWCDAPCCVYRARLTVPAYPNSYTWRALVLASDELLRALAMVGLVLMDHVPLDHVFVAMGLLFQNDLELIAHVLPWSVVVCGHQM